MPFLLFQMSMAAATGSGKAAAASEAPAAKARQLASSRLTTRLSKRGSGGRSARLRRSKMGVAGAIRLQLSYHPVSDKPLPYRWAALFIHYHLCVVIF